MFSQQKEYDEETKDANRQVYGKAPAPVDFGKEALRGTVSWCDFLHWRKKRQHTSHDRAQSIGKPSDDGKDGPAFCALFERDLVSEDCPGQDTKAGRGDALERSSEKQHRINACRRACAEGASDDHE